MLKQNLRKVLIIEKNLFDKFVNNIDVIINMEDNMAGFLIAMISCALMSIQGVFNTNMTKSSSIWVTASFVQLTALITCVVMWFVDGKPNVWGLFSVQPKISLLGGIIGAFITFTVVKAVSSMGVANAEVTIVITQIAAAYLLELFGLFGSKKADFSFIKLLGIALAVAGVVIFNKSK